MAMATQNEDRLRMLKAFDETKEGVKGLVDSGLLQTIPEIFVRPEDELAREPKREGTASIQIPVIDMAEVQNPEMRKAILGQVRSASEKWGFFEVVNHGIPPAVVDGMLDGVRGFMELDVEEKKKYYSRDTTRGVRYTSSYDLFTARTASWRDTLSILFFRIHPSELPDSCRESTVQYSKHVETLGNILLSLFYRRRSGSKPGTWKPWSARTGIGFTATITRLALSRNWPSG